MAMIDQEARDHIILMLVCLIAVAIEQSSEENCFGLVQRKLLRETRWFI